MTVGIVIRPDPEECGRLFSAMVLRKDVVGDMVGRVEEVVDEEFGLATLGESINALAVSTIGYITRFYLACRGSEAHEPCMENTVKLMSCVMLVTANALVNSLEELAGQAPRDRPLDREDIDRLVEFMERRIREVDGGA